MKVITLDFETYYSKECGFSKLTTEEYIRHEEFQIIGVSVKVDDGETAWCSGDAEQIERFLHGFDWNNSAAVAHNAMFDMAILNWCFGIKPTKLQILSQWQRPFMVLKLVVL